MQCTIINVTESCTWEEIFCVLATLIVCVTKYILIEQRSYLRLKQSRKPRKHRVHILVIYL